MIQRTLHVSVVVLIALSVLATGCKPQPPATTPDEIPAAPVPVERPSPIPETPPRQEVEEPSFGEKPIDRGDIDMTADEINRSGVLKTVYFEFDSYDLGADARLALQDNARWLAANPDYDIRVEGHCDERGTIEYNLALGERRAASVRDYLVSLGVDPFRVRIVSYGEEDPVDPGHDEAAWAKNRRAEFVAE